MTNAIWCKCPFLKPLIIITEYDKSLITPYTHQRDKSRLIFQCTAQTRLMLFNLLPHQIKSSAINGKDTGLEQAKQIDEDCALMSCSWRQFQIMYENYKTLGYVSIQEFIKLQFKNESNQLKAFLHFVGTKNGKVGSKMFKHVRNAQYLIIKKTMQGAEIGFNEKLSNILNIHQFGLISEVEKTGKYSKHAKHELLGFSQ